jgi:hypothetical protein
MAARDLEPAYIRCQILKLNQTRPTLHATSNVASVHTQCVSHVHGRQSQTCPGTGFAEHTDGGWQQPRPPKTSRLKCQSMRIATRIPLLINVWPALCSHRSHPTRTTPVLLFNGRSPSRRRRTQRSRISCTLCVYVNDLRFRLQLPPPRPTSLVLTDQLLAVAAAEATPDHCWSTALLNQANNRVNRGRPAPMAPDLSITAQMITSEQRLCYLLLAKAR